MISIQKISQEALDELAQSVAQFCFERTRLLTGFKAGQNEIEGMAHFSFRVGEVYALADVEIEALKAGQWQPVYEWMREHVLKKAAPWAVRDPKEVTPRDTVNIVNGRRHFRMFAEGGRLGFH